MSKILTDSQIDDLRGKKYFLLDMDGTIYLDTVLFQGTLPFLATLARQNKRAVYITNNASKAAVQYVEKLQGLGISAAEADFCTSAHALVHNLKLQCPGARVYLVGTPALAEFLEQHGFSLVSNYSVVPEERPHIVVLSFDTTLTFDKLRIACDYLQEGVLYWGTHPDTVCPGLPHSVPDAGSFIECIRCATGRVPSFIAGKPNPCIVELIMEKYSCSPEEIAIVGDRLHTDILCALNAGVTAICVLSGETKAEDIAASEVQPDFVFDSIQDLYEILK